MRSVGPRFGIVDEVPKSISTASSAGALTALHSYLDAESKMWRIASNLAVGL